MPDSSKSALEDSIDSRGTITSSSFEEIVITDLADLVFVLN